jgi:hypothetical protein
MGRNRVAISTDGGSCVGELQLFGNLSGEQFRAYSQRLNAEPFEKTLGVKQ